MMTLVILAASFFVTGLLFYMYFYLFTSQNNIVRVGIILVFHMNKLINMDLIFFFFTLNSLEGKQ